MGERFARLEVLRAVREGAVENIGAHRRVGIIAGGLMVARARAGHHHDTQPAVHVGPRFHADITLGRELEGADESAGDGN